MVDEQAHPARHQQVGEACAQRLEQVVGQGRQVVQRVCGHHEVEAPVEVAGQVEQVALGEAEVGQAGGAAAELLHLPDHGVRGNGHGLIYEKNSDAALQPVLRWLAKHVGPPDGGAQEERRGAGADG